MKKKYLCFIICFFLITQKNFCEEKKETNIIPDKKLIIAAWKASSRISENPIKLEYVFEKSFINKTGEEKLIKTLIDLYNQTGSVINISTISFSNQYHGEFFFHTEKEYIIPVTIIINPKGKIINLSFRPPFKKTISVVDIIEKIKALKYERKGILIKKLTQIEDNLHAYNENEILAISNVFKLYILAYLAEYEKKWSRVILKEQKYSNLQSTKVSEYPNQAPLTIFTLAYHMIVDDDDLASEILIDYIGREKLEKYISKLISNYTLNIPLIKPSELIKIKTKTTLAEKYISLSETEKRKLLSSLEKENIEIEKINFSKPSFIDNIGWFASPSDICKIMDHLRVLNNQFANTILFLNKGLELKTGGYIWGGFKGGKDVGIISLNWLLQAKDNRYYCVSIIINDKNNEINSEEVTKNVQQLLDTFGVE
ncbi:MAG: class A beta-lactamase-related serine hydrolase [Elusimicrobiales bacterium]|nr:class A beta-lactamase-related serine hydrolase [Elusimicrobiales bacterium]